MGTKLFVIIDMQNGFQNEYTEGLDRKILDFLEELKGTGVRVIGTRYVNHAHTACFLFEGWKECMAGSRDAEILEKLLPAMEQVFDKDKYSCWNEQMRRYIRENEVDKVYFAGVNTGCCVLHSAFDCYNDVVDCSVITDLCGSTSGPAEHEAALVVLQSCITKERVITAAQAVKEIRS